MKAIKPKHHEDPGVQRPTHTVVEEPLWAAFLSMVKNELDEPFDEVAEISDANEVHFDSGGMVHANDPMVEVTINNTKFTCYARQVEFLVPSLRSARCQIGDLGEHVAVQGRWWQFILTKDTAAKIATAFEQQAAEKKDEVDAVWSNLRETAMLAKVVTPSRKQTKAHHDARQRQENFKNN